MAYPVYEDTGGIADGADYSVDVPFPSTVNDEDILIVALLDADNDTFSVPAGWALIREDGSNSNCSTCWMWMRADGTETGTQTFTSQLDAGAGVYGIMYRFSGCIITGTPFEDPDQTLVLQNTNYTRPAVTTSDIERLGVCCVNIEDNVSPAPTAGWTERVEQSSTLGGDAALQMQDKQIATATTETADTSTVGGNDYHGVVVFALLPVPGAGNDQIVGSATITFTDAAIMTGKGKLIGQSDVIFTDIAVLNGKGQIVGLSDVTFTDVAVVSGRGKLVGQGDIIITDTAVLRGSGKLIAQSDLAFTTQAILAAKGILAGIVNVVFSTLAVLSEAGAVGAMQALATITTTTNSIIKGIGKLVGLSDVTSSTAAIASGVGGLNVESNIVFSTNSILQGEGLFQGLADIVFTTSAILREFGAQAKGKIKKFFNYYY
jgi:hypothetical protein